MNASAGRGSRAAIRRAADALAQAAAWMLPRAQRRWAAAMISEVASIERDSEALRWSAGCLLAACAARGRAFHLLDSAGVRWGLIVVATLRAVDVSLPTLLTAAYRLQSGMATVLGALTPGNDATRLVPLMEAIPLWLHVLLVIGACCYLSAVACTVRQHPISAVLVMLGVVSEQLAALAARPIIAETGVVVVAEPSLLASFILPIVLPLLLAAAAASGSGRTQAHAR